MKQRQDDAENKLHFLIIFTNAYPPCDMEICCLNKIKDVKLYMIFKNKTLYACEVITLVYWVHQTEILIHSFKKIFIGNSNPGSDTGNSTY